MGGELGCSIPGYVPGYEGMCPPPEGMLSVPWAQGMVKCTLIKHYNKTIMEGMLHTIPGYIPLCIPHTLPGRV